MNRQTIFERYGGFAKVSQMVTSFYDKMIDSSVTGPYFTDVDMKRLIDHQTKFFSAVMGGPASFTTDHLERVHARLGITEEAFQEAVTLLGQTLQEFNLAPEDLNAVKNEVIRCKSYIVTRS